MEYLDEIKQVIELLDNIDDKYNSLAERDSEVDSKISDVYHYIENTTMNSKNSYRVVKELKTLLQQRRELKKERSILQIFQNEKERLKLKSNRSILLNQVCKEDKNYNQKYNYRIYNEEEFKEMMEK